MPVQRSAIGRIFGRVGSRRQLAGHEWDRFRRLPCFVPKDRATEDSSGETSIGAGEHVGRNRHFWPGGNRTGDLSRKSEGGVTAGGSGKALESLRRPSPIFRHPDITRVGDGANGRVGFRPSAGNLPCRHGHAAGRRTLGRFELASMSPGITLSAIRAVHGQVLMIKASASTVAGLAMPSLGARTNVLFPSGTASISLHASGTEHLPESSCTGNECRSLRREIFRECSHG